MVSPSRPSVLIFSLVYPPDPYSGAARPHRFMKYLQRLGYEVDVIAGGTADECVIEGHLYRLKADLEHAPKHSLVERLFRVSVFHHDEGITWVPRAVRLARKWRGRQPVIISTSPPFTTHLAALGAKIIYRWKWIADFRDPLAGNPYRSVRAHRVDRIVERLIFRYADALIANTQGVADMWRASYPRNERKIHVLPNGFDPDDGIGPAAIPARSQRVLRHVGTVYGDRYPAMLLASLKRLIQAGKCDPKSICVHLVGPMLTDVNDASSESWFRCDARNVPKSEADQLIAEADSLLLLDVTTSGAGLQVPAKIYDYIRIGRPVLACTQHDSAVDRILARSGIPYVCLYAGDETEEIDRRMLNFLSLPNEAVQPSDWFSQTFDAMAQAETLASIIERVAQIRRKG